MRFPFMSKADHTADVQKVAEQLRDPIVHAMIRRASRSTRIEVHAVTEYPLAGAGLPPAREASHEHDPRMADLVSAFDSARCNPLTAPEMDIILSIQVEGQKIMDINYDKYGRFKAGEIYETEHTNKFINKVDDLSEIRQGFEQERFGHSARHLGLIGQETRINAALQLMGARQRLRVGLDETEVISLGDGHAISHTKHIYGMVTQEFGPEPFRIAAREVDGDPDKIAKVIENYTKKSEAVDVDVPSDTPEP